MAGTRCSRRRVENRETRITVEKRPAQTLGCRMTECLMGAEPFVAEGEPSHTGSSPSKGAIAMSNVVAIMSMSLDGYVADPDDGVAEVFDWYFSSGDVEIHTGGSDPMTFRVSEPSAEHLRGLDVRARCRAHRSAHVRGRPGLGREPRVGTGVRPRPTTIPAGWPRPDSTVHFVTDGIESAVAPGQGRRRREVRRGPRRRHHPAVPERRPPRRDPRRHRGGPARLRGPTLRPPRRHAGRPRQPDGDRGRRRDPPALPGARVLAPRRSAEVGPDGLSRALPILPSHPVATSVIG